jgi:hypothetical protein
MSLILGILDSGGAAAGGGASYESIATVSVGSGGTTSVDFTSIPSTYTHLQIRGILRTTETGATYDGNLVRMRFNNDTGTNYTMHALVGYGSGVFADAAANVAYMEFARTAINGNSASMFAVAVTDILDYKDTNKFKTLKTLSGVELNGGGRIYLSSNLWRSTSAITDIKIYPSSSFSFVQYSQFALYGIKGA